MKPLKEVIDHFPEASFKEVLLSKFADLSKRAATDDQKKTILELKEVYSPLINTFDTTFEYLREVIKQDPKLNVADIEAEELERVIDEYKLILTKVENLDIGTPDFENAKNQLRNTVSDIANAYRPNQEKSINLKRFIIGITSSIKLKPLFNSNNAAELESALNIAEKLKKQIGTIESGYQAAESLLNKREKLMTRDLEKKIDELGTKAALHGEKKIWLWFICGCGLGIIAICAFFLFIHGFSIFGKEIKAASDITVGTALLRLGLVSVILYFAFFCLKQFNIHRHLFQIYSFKKISLKIMNDLRGESDEIEKKLILAKGLEAIFNEPSTGLVNQPADHSGDYWQSVQRILEKIVTKDGN